jgi:hypothetical protein
VRGWGIATCWVAVCASTFVPSASRAEEPPPTHASALGTVAEQVVGELLTGAEFPPGRPVVLATPVPGDTLGLLTQRMVERLRGRGLVVRLSGHVPNGGAPPNGGVPPSGEPVGMASGTIAPDSLADPEMPGGGAAQAPAPAAPARGSGGSSDPVQLQLQVDGAAVTYVRRLGKFPFGTKGYERLSAMRAVATLLDAATGEVFWSRSASRSLTDVVPKGSVAYAASGSGRLNPPVPKGGTRWLEPLIVVGVVAGLVVLFYSNRN